LRASTGKKKKKPQKKTRNPKTHPATQTSASPLIYPQSRQATDSRIKTRNGKQKTK